MYNSLPNSQSFENELNAKFNKLLAEYNSRNVSNTDQKINLIKEILYKNVITSISLKFGGSLSKNTYIDGISDFDILVYINNTELSSKNSRSAIDNIRNILTENMKADRVDIKVGPMAITITYPDNTIIQLLPAIRDITGFKLPAANGTEWSNIIIPERFINDLVYVNQRCNGKVIPIIKLVKIINSQLPENLKLKGYHIEAMALEIFYNYPYSTISTRVMIEDFYEKAKERVRYPIVDKTNQSKYVDEDLGLPDSQMRRDRSNILNNIYNKMKGADRTGSIQEWESILGSNKN